MSEDEQLAKMTITEMSEVIGSGAASPVEVMTATLARIERLNGDFKAFISVYPELAMAAARQAEEELSKGQNRGPLHGVPMAVKDLFAVKDMRRTCGSAFLHEAPASQDATSVARLKEAGAIMVGLLNLNEFAYGPTGINPHHGSARNPWHADYACGGSSAGSGSAVAAALVPAALGSDTGGSIRIPASLCGIVGLKQSFGLASREGIYPLCHSFDHGGPLTRTVADAALILQAIAGPDAKDSTTRHAEALDYSRNLNKDIAGFRIGVPDSYYFDRLHEDVEQSVLAGIEILRRRGCRVDPITLPDMRAASIAWATMSVCEAFDVHEQNVAAHGVDFAPDVLGRLELGRNVPATDYLRAQRHQDQVRREMAMVMADFDAILTPTTVMPGVSLATGHFSNEMGDFDGPKLLGRFTRLACFTGQPAISLPCGISREGLPIGLQLIGKMNEDDRLLQLAQGFEQAVAFERSLP